MWKFVIIQFAILFKCARPVFNVWLVPHFPFVDAILVAIHQRAGRNALGFGGLARSALIVGVAPCCAIQIEKRYTKREIFTLYCNQMYFGHGVYGVEAASRLYFSKSAKDVTLEEAACEPFVGLVPQEFPDYHYFIDTVFASTKTKPQIVEERDLAAVATYSVEQGVRFFREEAYLEEASARREAERGRRGDPLLVLGRRDELGDGVAIEPLSCNLTRSGIAFAS